MDSLINRLQATEPGLVDASESGDDVLAVLSDDGCRAILELTGDQARSSGEISEACDLSQSSTYRKLDTLVDAGLLRKRVRIRASGKHVHEYERTFDEVVISIDDADGFEVMLASDGGEK